jgi:hypothetical protein
VAWVSARIKKFVQNPQAACSGPADAKQCG